MGDVQGLGGFTSSEDEAPQRSGRLRSPPVSPKRIDQRVAEEVRCLVDEYGAHETASLDKVIDRHIQLFGGEARMGPIDRMVLERLRRMADGACSAIPQALPRRRRRRTR